MPVYTDSDGNRYWFDAEPDFTVVRNDLVLAPPELPEEQPIEPEA
jgi:hypothetical protein